MKIAFAVMAHENRAKWFPYLKKNLGQDVPFHVDSAELKLGTWLNCKRAWESIPADADYGFVIQDDAILCKDFIEHLKDFISRFPGEDCYQLFFGNRPSTEKIALECPTLHDGYIRAGMMWGVAIGFARKHIRPMIDYCDNLPGDLPDDSRIRQYCLRQNIKAIYPWPSLVDHRDEQSLVKKYYGYERKAIRFKDQKTIPKVFHQIWIGDKQIPSETRSWRNVREYKYRLWTDKDLDKLPMINRRLYDYFISKECWFGAADVARLEILNLYGGIYIDADTRKIKAWKRNIDSDCEFFSCRANTKPSEDYRIANGVIGSIPGHPIVREYIKRMGRARKVEPCWNTIGGTMLTGVVEDLKDENVKILEPDYFYSINSRGYKSDNPNLAVAIHYWGSTKGLYK